MDAEVGGNVLAGAAPVSHQDNLQAVPEFAVLGRAKQGVEAFGLGGGQVDADHSKSSNRRAYLSVRGWDISNGFMYEGAANPSQEHARRKTNPNEKKHSALALAFSWVPGYVLLEGGLPRQVTGLNAESDRMCSMVPALERLEARTLPSFAP